jgi:hypothetical protein
MITWVDILINFTYQQQNIYLRFSGVPRNFFWRGSTNSVENRGQRERGSGDGSPLVRGSAQFTNERNLYSYSYGYIFHRTRNLAQLCQNFGNSGGGV